MGANTAACAAVDADVLYNAVPLFGFSLYGVHRTDTHTDSATDAVMGDEIGHLMLLANVVVSIFLGYGQPQLYQTGFCWHACFRIVSHG